MVASAISGFVALGASSLYVFIMDNFRIMVDQNTAQESLLWTAYQSKGWLQQAKSVNANFNVQASNEIAEGRTRIIFDFDRETSTGGNGVEAFSQIAITNIHNELDLSNPAGEEMEFNMNNTDQNPFLDKGLMGKAAHFRSRAGAPLAGLPTWSDSVWYDRLSQYDVINVTGGGGSPETVTLQISTRYFINHSSGNVLNFCKPATICPNTNTNFSELSMNVVVGMRNMNFGGGAGPGGLHGNLYYYQFMAPPILTGIDYNN